MFDNKTEQKVYYYTIEPYPLPEEILKKLNHVSILGNKTIDRFKTIHKSEEKNIRIGENIIFKKSRVCLEEISLEKNSFDIIFFDAFAPSKQPDIYCSSSKFKRSLTDIGYDIEVLSGPVGKKEMVRATKR